MGNRNADTGVADVHVRGDGVLVFDYRKDAEISLEDARNVVAEASQLVSEPRPTLVLMKQVRKVDRAARVYFSSSPENLAISSHVALVTGSPVSRMIANFFIGLNRPPDNVPTRLFGSEEDAVKWLERFIA